jgi:hypothetical protein
MAIGYFWTFGKIPPFLVYCTKKNLATLMLRAFRKSQTLNQLMNINLNFVLCVEQNRLAADVDTNVSAKQSQQKVQRQSMNILTCILMYICMQAPIEKNGH